MQPAVKSLSEREKRSRFARELSKLDSREEKQLAEQGLENQENQGQCGLDPAPATNK